MSSGNGSYLGICSIVESRIQYIIFSLFFLVYVGYAKKKDI